MKRAFETVEISAAPISAFRTSPRPPKRLVPPMTAAAMASISRVPPPALRSTLLRRAASTMPPRPDIAPAALECRPHHSPGVGDADDRRHDPAGQVAEKVVREVVDLVVLDHDHALGDRAQDHSLPDLVAGERDDEGRHADEGDDGALKH